MVLRNRWKVEVQFILGDREDFNALDLFLWGMVKEQIYETPVDSVEHLENNIHDACRSVTPEKLMCVRRFF